MKFLKLMVLLVVTALTFGSARAQVRVKVAVGPYLYHGHHYFHRKPYVKNHHTYYRYY